MSCPKIKIIKERPPRYVSLFININGINGNLGGLSFYEDETGKYVVGADAVPKKLGDLGYSFSIEVLRFSGNYSGSKTSSKTIDIKEKYGNYAELPTSYFRYLSQISYTQHVANPYNGIWDVGVSYSYVQSTGMLTITCTVSYQYQYTYGNNDNGWAINVPLILPQN